MEEVRLAWPHERQDCLDVRREVFVLGQDVPEALEVDGEDDACVHVVARAEDGRAVGTARLRVTDEGAAKIERVAVRASHRGRGIASRIMHVIEAEAAAQGHAEVLLSAQRPVIPFYEARGYLAYGPEFDEAGIPHRRMRLRLRSGGSDA